MNPQVSPKPHTHTVSCVGVIVITAAMPTQLTVTLRVIGSGLPENNKAKETGKKSLHFFKKKRKKKQEATSHCKDSLAESMMGTVV